MQIHEIISAAKDGDFRPVHLLVGTEQFLVDRAMRALRAAVLGPDPTGFNEDLFHGKGLAAQSVLAAARTLPMMGNARFVLVRDFGSVAPSEQEKFAEYLADPTPSTCLVLIAQKLDGRSKLAKKAKKSGVVTDAKPLRTGELHAFLRGEAQARGHHLAPEAAASLVDAIGSDLGAFDDALERLSLFVGAGAPIPLEAVEACVTRVRTESIWRLVDAVSLRDLEQTLAATGSLLADREPPLRILAMVARQLRMVSRMRQALASGLRGREAATEAGAPPFKAADLTEAARRFRAADLGRAFTTLSNADRALKMSRRPPELILEEALVRLCTREGSVGSSKPGHQGQRRRAN